MPETGELGLKSRRLSFYDLDKQRTRQRVFTALEIAHVDKIFSIVEHILLEDKINLRNKWVSSGLCGCGSHQDTFYMMELDSKYLGVESVHEIEDALKEYCSDVKLVDILAQHERQKNFLQLVLQQQHQQSLDSNDCLEH
jgi:hypothetical protein